MASEQHVPGGERRTSAAAPITVVNALGTQPAKRGTGPIPKAMAASTRRLQHDYLRPERPWDFLLLLWPTLWGLWLSGAGRPDWDITFVFVVGAALMFLAGHARRVHFARAAAIKAGTAVSGPESDARSPLFAARGLALVALLPMFLINEYAMVMAVMAAILAFSWPAVDNGSLLAKFHLGVVFGFGIPLAYAAQLGGIPPIVWWLLLANALWAIAWKTHLDGILRNDTPDSMPVGVGLSLLAFLCVMVYLGIWQHFHYGYYLALAGAGVVGFMHLRYLGEGEGGGLVESFKLHYRVGALVFVACLMAYLP